MHSDRVICYWCAADDTSDYRYEYLYNISYDNACLKADKESMKMSLQNHCDEIVEEAKKNCDISNINDFAIELDRILLEDYINYSVYKVCPELLDYKEFENDPEAFCRDHCVQEA